MLQKEIKDWAFKAYLLVKETSSWFLLIGSLKITYTRALCAWVLNLYLTERVWSSSRHVLPKRSKIIDLSKVVKNPNRFNFDLPKVSKITINCELLKVGKMTGLKIYIYNSSHREARNMKFGHQINIIERVPLGTSSQAVVMLLGHNHLINLFISNYRGAAVIKFKQ